VISRIAVWLVANCYTPFINLPKFSFGLCDDPQSACSGRSWQIVTVDWSSVLSVSDSQSVSLACDGLSVANSE